MNMRKENEQHSVVQLSDHLPWRKSIRNIVLLVHGQHAGRQQYMTMVHRICCQKTFHLSWRTTWIVGMWVVYPFKPVCWTWNLSLWSRVRQILRVYVSWMAMNWKETYENSRKKKRKGPGMGSSMHGRQVKSGRRWRGTGTLVTMGCHIGHSGARQRLRGMARHCMTKANNRE